MRGGPRYRTYVRAPRAVQTGGGRRESVEAEVLHDRLLDTHTLQVADFDGDGRPDLYVGEMGRADWTVPHPPPSGSF